MPSLGAEQFPIYPPGARGSGIEFVPIMGPAGPPGPAGTTGSTFVQPDPPGVPGPWTWWVTDPETGEVLDVQVQGAP